MKKSIIVLITLALIAAMLFSCSNAQQESSAAGSGDSGTSVAESGYNESSAEESSAPDEPADDYPDEFAETNEGPNYMARYKRISEGSTIFEVTSSDETQYWLWDSRSGPDNNEQTYKFSIAHYNTVVTMFKVGENAFVFNGNNAYDGTVFCSFDENHLFSKVISMRNSWKVEKRGESGVLFSAVSDGKDYLFFDSDCRARYYKSVLPENKLGYDFIAWDGDRRYGVNISGEASTITALDPELLFTTTVRERPVDIYEYPEIYPGLGFGHFYQVRIGYQNAVAYSKMEPYIINDCIFYGSDIANQRMLRIKDKGERNYEDFPDVGEGITTFDGSEYILSAHRTYSGDGEQTFTSIFDTNFKPLGVIEDEYLMFTEENSAELNLYIKKFLNSEKSRNSQKYLDNPKLK